MSVLPTPKLYSYVRLSSAAQLKGDSQRRQEDLIEKYTKEKGLELDDELRYKDKAVSAFRGKNVADGELGYFLEAIREKKVSPGSLLLVESLDRITRMEISKALPVFLEIINAGVTIVTLADEMEHSAKTVNGNMLGLFGSLMILARAHEESQMKSFRLKRTWEQKRKDLQTKPYTARIPSWLELNPDRITFSVNKKKSQTVRRMFKLCLKGEHCEGIARIFHSEKLPTVGKGKLWTHSFVAQALRSPSVTGNFTPHKIVEGKRVPAGVTIDDYYPRIVSDEDFHRVQQIMDARTMNKGGRHSPEAGSLFRKKLFCGYCGSPVYRSAKGVNQDGSPRRVLICRNAKDKTGCFYIGWKYDEFETAFLKLATELNLALNDKVAGKNLREESEQLAGAKVRKQKQISNLLKLVEDGDENGKTNDMRVVRKRVTELEGELDEIEKRTEEVERQLSFEKDGPTNLIQLKSLTAKLHHVGTRKKAADLISRLFARIDLYSVGSHFQFAKYKAAHGKLVKQRGKNDGWVAVQMRENYDRREYRFFDAVLQLPGVGKRLRFTDSNSTVRIHRLDMTDDKPVSWTAAEMERLRLKAKARG